MRGKKQKEPVGFNPAEIFAALELLEDKLPADFAWIAAGVIFLDAIMIIVLGNTLCKKK